MGNQIAEIKSRINLIDEVGKLTKVTKVGTKYKACCPFHREQTPSFFVTKTRFNCFSCGARGDALDFFQRLRNLSFSEVMKLLRNSEEPTEIYKLPDPIGLTRPKDFEQRLKDCELRLPRRFIWAQLLNGMSHGIKESLSERIAFAKTKQTPLEIIRTMHELPDTIEGNYKALALYERLCNQWEERWADSL